MLKSLFGELTATPIKPGSPVPSFAATAVLLMILYQYQAGAAPGPVGLVSLEGLSASERIVLEATPPEPDLILTAVMEGGGT